MRVTLLGNSSGRAMGSAKHVSKHAAGSRFKLTGLRIGGEEASEVSGGPRATPAAVQTLQQDLLGCDPVKSQQRAFLARA